jgi:hypothetical protein
MRREVDFPQSRALMLNHCSVSEGSGIQLGTVGGPSAVAHEGTEAHEGRSEGNEGFGKGVAVSDAGNGDTGRGDADLSARTGCGGTSP